MPIAASERAGGARGRRTALYIALLALSGLLPGLACSVLQRPSSGSLEPLPATEAARNPLATPAEGREPSLNDDRDDLVLPANSTLSDDSRPIPPQYTDPSLFLSAIMRAEGPVSLAPVSGLTVPHHLLARDLIARGFRFASGARPRRIVLLSPDHFNLGETVVSVAARDSLTALGPLQSDQELAGALERLPFVRKQGFFYREHGVQAILPFVAHHFPDARILVLCLKTATDQRELDAIVDALSPRLGDDDLIIQSTDFSHYLDATEAGRRDVETLAALQLTDPARALGLSQPDHLDSRAAQYLQLRLQRERFGASLQILAQANSQDYASERITETTSYIVQGYLRGPSP